MRKLRRMWGGKFSVWCETHKHRFRLFGLILVLVALFLLASYLDKRDLEQKLDGMQKRVAQLEQEQQIMKQMPSTVFVLEAKTPDELSSKLARIAGQLDAERVKLLPK